MYESFFFFFLKKKKRKGKKKKKKKKKSLFFQKKKRKEKSVSVDSNSLLSFFGGMLTLSVLAKDSKCENEKGGAQNGEKHDDLKEGDEIASGRTDGRARSSAALRQISVRRQKIHQISCQHQPRHNAHRHPQTNASASHWPKRKSSNK